MGQLLGLSSLKISRCVQVRTWAGSPEQCEVAVEHRNVDVAPASACLRHCRALRENLLHPPSKRMFRHAEWERRRQQIEGRVGRQWLRRPAGRRGRRQFRARRELRRSRRPTAREQTKQSKDAPVQEEQGGDRRPFSALPRNCNDHEQYLLANISLPRRQPIPVMSPRSGTVLRPVPRSHRLLWNTAFSQTVCRRQCRCFVCRVSGGSGAREREMLFPPRS